MDADLQDPPELLLEMYGAKVISVLTSIVVTNPLFDVLVAVLVVMIVRNRDRLTDKAWMRLFAVTSLAGLVPFIVTGVARRSMFSASVFAIIILLNVLSQMPLLDERK